ncbi:hypothetical protein GOP47_0013042 [Adiantum capillus-veneris]|uniref:Uncharacterized protein n=1 Tax=Adiantum capillus-veneris TaxID=13818 RepID=A0A9D4US13_ADICA|nr:hypothetical protein GOP47_0013042 [Adiantum capillus-veneris]
MNVQSCLPDTQSENPSSSINVQDMKITKDQITLYRTKEDILKDSKYFYDRVQSWGVGGRMIRERGRENLLSFLEVEFLDPVGEDEDEEQGEAQVGAGDGPQEVMLEAEDAVQIVLH